MVGADRLCAMITRLKAIGVGLVVAVLSSLVTYWVLYFFLLKYVWPMTVFPGCDD